MFDNIGPRYAVTVYSPNLKVRGFLVIDNTNLGPGKGGIRLTPTVTEEEVARLARAMTYKNVLAGLPFGGAKAGINYDPKAGSPKDKARIVAWFARDLKPFLLKYYIAGPDINMNEKDMAVFVRAAGNRRAATGKPARLGGLPHELGSTGFGVAIAAKIALAHKKIAPRGVRVAIEGFGNVGIFAAKFLDETGAKIVAVSDSQGAIYNPQGLKYRELLTVKKKTGSVVNYQNGEKIPGAALFELAVEVLIPAALPDVINDANAGKIQASVIVEGANIAVTRTAEAELTARGVLVIPDIIANAGGVISSYAEHQGFSAGKMFKLVEDKITRSVKTTLIEAAKIGQTPRQAAMTIAERKLSSKSNPHSTR